MAPRFTLDNESAISEATPPAPVEPDEVTDEPECTMDFVKSAHAELKRASQELDREAYVDLFKRVRVLIFKAFNAINLCRSTDMHVRYTEGSKYAVRPSPCGNGLLVRIDNRSCGSREIWFVSYEMLAAGRATRNKLAAEAGHLSFRYQGLLKSAHLKDMKAGFVRTLEDNARSEGVWCQQLSDNIKTRLAELEAERQDCLKQAREFVTKMPIYFIPKILSESEDSEADDVQVVG